VENTQKTYSLKSKDYGRILCTIKISYVVDKGTYYEKSYEKEFWLDLTYVTDKTRRELESENEYLEGEVKDLRGKAAIGAISF
jgi:hypothetical protein